MDIRINKTLCSDPRFGALQDKRGGTRSEIVGNLVQMWLATRDCEGCEHDRETLLQMMPGRAAARESMLADLIEAGYIRALALQPEESKPRYQVVDDLPHFAAREQMSVIGRLGGLATAKRSAKQPRSERAARRARSPKEAPTAIAWESYSEAYMRRWGVEPTRNSKVNGMMCQFVARVGMTDAPEVLRFYVAHNEGWYVQKQHDLSLALRDAEALTTQWRRGAAITRNDVREHENHDRIETTLQRIGQMGFVGT